MVAILVLLTIIVFLTIDYLVERARAPGTSTAPAAAAAPLVVRAPADIWELPGGVFVGPGHAWMELRPTGAVRLGADRVPVTLLGGVDEVEVAPPGSVLHRGDPAAVLRKGGREIKLRTPVDGEVTAVNGEVAARPEGLAGHPFGRGWLVTMKPHDLGAAIQRMFVAEGAVDWMRRELGRLREALVGLGGGGALAGATLPDGGLPVEGLAGRLDDETWRCLTAELFEPGEEAAAEPLEEAA